jgi:phosphoglycolate phosphatase
MMGMMVIKTVFAMAMEHRLSCKDVVFEPVAAILWDKDGTLADSHKFLKTLAQRRSRFLEQRFPGVGAPLLAAFGCADNRYDPAGLMAVGTRYENEIAAATYLAARGMAWAEAVQSAQAAFLESDRSVPRKADFTPPCSGIPALLHHCHQQGLRQAVLSGDTTANIHDFLERYDLASYMAWHAGSESPPVKPDPQMVWTACDHLGIAPEQCLVIGDSALDAQLARQSGCQGFVSVTWGGSPAIAGADVVLDHPQQFSRHLAPI